MALYRVRLIGEQASGVPEDRMSFSWGVDAGSVPSATALHDAWLATWGLPSVSTGLRSLLPAQWGTYAWEIRAAAGGPVLDYLETARVAGTGTAAFAPQISISVQSLVSLGFNTARRGRFAFGPIQGAAGAGRPSAATVSRLLAGCVLWHQTLAGLGYAPRVLTGGGTVGTPIIGYTCSNTYSTTRSRSSEATSRTEVVI